MTAGLNVLVNIIRYTYDPDDAIGGAVLTGTVCYWNVSMRLEADKPTHAFLEQGLETVKTFSGLMVPGTLDIRNRDEVEIVAPRDHWDYGKRFRVIGDPERGSFSPRDPRNHMTLNLERSNKAHARQ